jgi:aminopeptidase N
VLVELLFAVAREPDALNRQQILDTIRTAFWRYTAPDDRTAIAARVERVLRTGLDRARLARDKGAWFGALRSVATTTATLDWLERVWARKETIAGLPLADTDEADLAFDLAVRDVPNAEAILATELARLDNPDRRARFAFIMPAVSREVGVREQFFQTLRAADRRQHEAWVVDALRYLHHPLRAGTSKILVRPALDLLSEIQRTGDIFFPKRWADATLSGYQSIQTAADVREFLDALPPAYPARLRDVVLSAADPLFRAAELQR